MAGDRTSSMRWSALAAALCLFGCRTQAPAAVDAGVCECPAPAQASALPPIKPPARQEPTASSPHVTPLAVCEAKGRLPLDAAQSYFDQGDFEKALSCAAQAAALAPGDALAYAEKGNALAALERWDEAKLAYTRALAIDPESLEALAGAAHLYAVLLPSSRELDELGSVYAERGLDLSTSQHDDEFAIYFARLSSMAFNDIGQPEDALDRADWVLERKKGDPEAQYERAVALFELCRFKEARAAFNLLLPDKERSAFAHHHLGLLVERDGKQKEADEHFAKARALDPQAFPDPVLLSKEDFQRELDQVLAGLSPDMKKDLAGVPVEMEDLPLEDDLVANDPPLSPTILGLFRGPPLGESCLPEPNAKPDAPCRSIAVYRRNLSRAVKTREELIEQIRVTLLHEIGHLRGEDDYELAARGLE
ncbi:MAG: metallopeptidase family protein [Myxococcota bacterium]